MECSLAIVVAIEINDAKWYDWCICGGTISWQLLAAALIFGQQFQSRIWANKIDMQSYQGRGMGRD